MVCCGSDRSWSSPTCSQEELCDYWLCQKPEHNMSTTHNYADFSSDTLCSSSALSSCLVKWVSALVDGCAYIGGGFCEFWICPSRAICSHVGCCGCWLTDWFEEDRTDANNWCCCSIRLRCNWSSCCASWGALGIPILFGWFCKLLKILPSKSALGRFDCCCKFCEILLLVAGADWGADE